jgi:hypothetical protein
MTTYKQTQQTKGRIKNMKKKVTTVFDGCGRFYLNDFKRVISLMIIMSSLFEPTYAIDVPVYGTALTFSNSAASYGKSDITQDITLPTSLLGCSGNTNPVPCNAINKQTNGLLVKCATVSFPLIGRARTVAVVDGTAEAASSMQGSMAMDSVIVWWHTFYGNCKIHPWHL